MDWEYTKKEGEDMMWRGEGRLWTFSIKKF